MFKKVSDGSLIDMQKSCREDAKTNVLKHAKQNRIWTAKHAVLARSVPATKLGHKKRLDDMWWAASRYCKMLSGRGH